MNIPTNDLLAIRYRIFEIFETANIHTLPICLDSIIDLYGIHITTFKKAMEYGLKLDGDDGYTIMRKIGSVRVFLIIINESIDPLTKRVVIAHELGHILLGHFDEHYENAEALANAFALELLAPIPIVANFKTPMEICRSCMIPLRASVEAMNRNKRLPLRLLRLYQKRFAMEIATELCA